MLERSVHGHCSVVTKSSQPLQDKNNNEIISVVTKSNQLLQDGKQYEISSVATKSKQPLHNGELQDAGVRELPNWCDLPDLVLLSILKRLTSLGDFFAFGRVCKGWRLVSEFMKREYMATQPPLLCGSTSHRDFYSWKEEKLYKKDQPALKGGMILGFSHGFLILLHESDQRFISLVNPVRVEIMANFPLLPECLNSRYVLSHASLMSPPTSPDCLLLLSDLNFIFLCRPGDLKWAVYPRDYGRSVILCEIFFKGKVYALNDRGHILIYDPSHPPKFTFLRAKNNLLSDSICRSSTRLADCGGELFAIQCFEYSNRRKKVKFVVHRFDFMTCEWVRLNNLGNNVLFLDSCRGAFWDDADNWGGSGNCIYYLPNTSNEEKFSVFHMKGGRVEDIFYPGPCFSSCWVFPRLCC
ncbi:hypothetical protein QJS04_geneDACA019310 [Acorus gramineus]|uniref:F-box domain-containing protein n=1 Tax=Acorus gramineus TaxID=55184 RepID=A0AAV9APF6_ACOGR|nr:hypothetical protein QJS04_geneDACA019310 [Acorus gramineus]